jgi:hypothetical protein
MASLDLTGTLETLQGERARILQEITKLDKAIDVIRELGGEAEASSNRRVAKHTMSASARRRIAQAQKLRWAKVREQKKAKA